jgi:hypothetical protein
MAPTIQICLPLSPPLLIDLCKAIKQIVQLKNKNQPDSTSDESKWVLIFAAQEKKVKLLHYFNWYCN